MPAGTSPLSSIGTIIRPFYLSPYSPDFNSIERLWQHLKSHYLAGFITADGNELTDKILNSLQALIKTPQTLTSVCSPPNLIRK